MPFTITQHGGPWGRPSTPRPSSLLTPTREAYTQLPSLLPGIPRGGGQSYSRAATGPRHIHVQGAPSIQLLDPNTIRVSAGLSLRQLLPVLAEHYHRTIPVIPGTPAATIGGCVAADVHGKQHPTTGSFSDHVTTMQLVTSLGSRLDLFPGSSSWRATISGFGLTGLILHVDLHTVPIPSSWHISETVATASLRETLHVITESSLQTYHTVAHLAPFSGRRQAGTALVTRSRWALPNEVPASAKTHYAWHKPTNRPLPLLPCRWLTDLALRIGYWTKSRTVGPPRLIPAASALFPAPPDYWRLFGRQGLRQYQCWVPFTSTESLITLFDVLNTFKLPVFVSLRQTGPPSQAYLAFIGGPGWSLAIDAPNIPLFIKLFHQLDQIVLDAGGRVNLAKTDHMTPTVLRRMYPEVETWKTVQREMDPACRWISDLARNLDLLSSPPANN